MRRPIIQAQIPSPQPSPRSGGERELFHSVRVPSCAELSAEEPPGWAQLAASAIHFTNENASFTPVSSPAAGARSIGPVMIANLRKKNPLIFDQALDRKKIEFIVYF